MIVAQAIVCFKKTMLISVVFIFVSGVTCDYGWDNVSCFEKKQVRLFFQAAETKLVLVKRYKFV